MGIYDAIIFDIDGTLWDATEANANGWNAALEELNIETRVDAEDLARVAGKPYLECVDILLPGLREAYPTLANLIHQNEAKYVSAEGGKFYPGVQDVVFKLAEEYPIFLISNCHGAYLEVFLKFASFSSLIKDYDCNGISQLPKHQMITNMVQKHELKNPVYIGDTETDRLACEKAGVDFIFASYGFGEIAEAKLTIAKLNELENLLINSH